MVEITITEAKERLEDLLIRIQKGEDFLIVDKGKTVAFLTSPEIIGNENAEENAFAKFFEMQKKHPIGTLEEIKSWKNEGRP